ncbi:MAG: AEC family transporter [Actinobacteria bacterium]|nr:AEC family transporter [Actinomycetota bacterium]
MKIFGEVILEVISATLPIFAVIAIGFFIRKKNIIKDEHIPALNNLTYNFGLSTLVFSGIVKNSFSEIFDAEIIKVIFPSYFIFIAIVFLSFYFTKTDMKLKSAVIVSSFRTNMAFIGLPIVLYAYGTISAAKGGVIIAFLMPLNIMLSALFFHINSRSSNGFKISRLLKEIFLDPVILAVIVGLALSYFRIELPEPVDRILEILSNIAVPLALISIGASFKFSSIKNNVKYISLICILKLILFPLITLIFSVFVFDTSALNRDTICVLFATPVAVATYIQSRKYSTDSEFISAVIIVSTIASSFTVSGWLFLLKFL